MGSVSGISSHSALGTGFTLEDLAGVGTGGEQDTMGFEEVGQDLPDGGGGGLVNADVQPLAREQGNDNLVNALRQNRRIEHDRLSAKNVVGNFIHSIGRKIMGFCSAVAGFFRLTPPAHSLAKMNELVKLRQKEQVEKGPFAGTENNAVEYSDEAFAAASGLTGTITRKPFTPEEVAQIKKGDFSLADIKQDPALQDCWFLSSLASVLAAKGANYISNLIHIPEPTENEPQPSHAYVKLGDDTYKVPLAEICGNGGKTKGVSDSKPWVKLLETAMQMHMIRHGGENPSMHRNDASKALNALLGRNSSVSMAFHTTAAEQFATIQKSLLAGKPVVLATSPSNVNALKTGISPRHAVAVLDIISPDYAGKTKENLPENATPGYLVVQDPYGHITVVKASDLTNVTVISEEVE